MTSKQDQPEKPKSDLFPLISASLAYAVTGFSFASTGSVIPLLRNEFHVSNALAGLVFPAIYAGLILGDFIAMWNIQVRGAKILANLPADSNGKNNNRRDLFGSRNPNKQTLLIGCVWSTLSFFSLAVIPTGSTLGFIFFIVLYVSLGAGCSLLEVAVNCIYAESPNISLSVLMGHTSLGIGSLAAPSIFILPDLVFDGLYQPVFWILGGFSVFVTVLCMFPDFPCPEVNEEAPVVDTEKGNLQGYDESTLLATASSQPFWRHLVKQVGFWMLIFGAYFAVGAELIFGGWIFSLMEEKGYQSLASVAQFLFWFGMLFGRIAFTLVSNLSFLQGLQGSIRASLASAFFGATVPLCFTFINDLSPYAMCALACATGLSIALLFPLLFAMNGEKYFDPVTKSTNQSVGLILLADNCGGMSMPFVVGVVGSALSIQEGFVVGPACVFVVLIVLSVFALADKRERRRAGATPKSEEEEEEIPVPKLTPRYYTPRAHYHDGKTPRSARGSKTPRSYGTHD